MCGRYFIDMEDTNIKIWLNENNNDVKANEVFPTNKGLVLTYDKKIIAKAIPWGFKKWDNKGHVINARSETIATNRFFKHAFKQKKAIVLASGFYEWNDAKVKHIITPKDNSIFYMAALIQEEDQGFAIVTQQATHPVASIHNRQPIMISDDHLIPYLTHQLDEQLEYYTSKSMDMHSVVRQATLL